MENSKPVARRENAQIKPFPMRAPFAALQNINVLTRTENQG
jgi:hypothetical protein